MEYFPSLIYNVLMTGSFHSIAIHIIFLCLLSYLGVLDSFSSGQRNRSLNYSASPTSLGCESLNIAEYCLQVVEHITTCIVRGY